MCPQFCRFPAQRPPGTFASRTTHLSPCNLLTTALARTLLSGVSPLHFGASPVPWPPPRARFRRPESSAVSHAFCPLRRFCPFSHCFPFILTSPISLFLRLDLILDGHVRRVNQLSEGRRIFAGFRRPCHRLTSQTRRERLIC